MGVSHQYLCDSFYLTENVCHMNPILVLFSDEFIHQGGDVPSQKTEVVSGVLCLAMFVFILAENINCSIAILQREK